MPEGDVDVDISFDNPNRFKINLPRDYYAEDGTTVLFRVRTYVEGLRKPVTGALKDQLVTVKVEKSDNISYGLDALRCAGDGDHRFRCRRCNYYFR